MKIFNNFLYDESDGGICTFRNELKVKKINNS